MWRSGRNVMLKRTSDHPNTAKTCASPSFPHLSKWNHLFHQVLKAKHIFDSYFFPHTPHSIHQQVLSTQPSKHISWICLLLSLTLATTLPLAPAIIQWPPTSSPYLHSFPLTISFVPSDKNYHKNMNYFRTANWKNIKYLYTYHPGTFFIIMNQIIVICLPKTI